MSWRPTIPKHTSEINEVACGRVRGHESQSGNSSDTVKVSVVKQHYPQQKMRARGAAVRLPIQRAQSKNMAAGVGGGAGQNSSLRGNPRVRAGLENGPGEKAHAKRGPKKRAGDMTQGGRESENTGSGWPGRRALSRPLQNITF